MKQILSKLAIALLAAAIFAAPATLRAEDTGTNSAATAKGKKDSGLKFYGPVTAVDTKAMTFTVGEQTFTVTKESELTKDDKPATLADAVVGEPARGSYVKASDGKLDITKTRFGKKGSAGGKSGSKKKKGADSTNAVPSAAN